MIADKCHNSVVVLTASSVVAADLVVVAFKPTSHLKARSKSFPPLFGFLLIKLFCH
jgi:hypothetical protein